MLETGNKKIIGVALLLVTIKISVFAVVITNTAFAGISALINVIPNRRLIGYGVREQIEDVIPSIMLSVVMFIAAYLCLGIGLSDFYTILLQVGVESAIYIIGSIIFKVDSFTYILKNLKRQ